MLPPAETGDTRDADPTVTARHAHLGEVGTTDRLTTPARPTALLERGVTVGRYVLIDRIGTGGMGVVYKAYDPELDRPVAIKLVRGSSVSSARDRLLREAQALARLSHPNVVSVFDVGTFGDDVYIAMEFVSGRTLRTWLGQQPRQAEILATFRAAGEGLAAAHRVGLVHRDVKPDNVLIGDDGRVRVLDFGLARTAARGSAPPTVMSEIRTADGSGDGADDSGDDRLSSPLTLAGSVMGTPRYMAPEQHDGGAIDARTDQFAFCVALYEALYRSRAFTGRDRAALAAAVRTGALAPPPADARVPRWLRQVVVRGLSPSPADRFASMDELLLALGRDPARTRRRVAAAVVAVAAAAVIAAVAAHSGSRAAASCGAGAARVAGIWDPARRGALRAAFTGTGLGYAASTAERVGAGVDAYAGAWARMRDQACEATHVRGEQSGEMLDLRMTCLDQRLAALDAQLGVFASADAVVVQNATQAVAALPGLDACADTTALRARVAAPTGAARDRVAAVRRDVDAADALYRAGKLRDALPLARAALTRAEDTGYSPVIAAAALVVLGVADGIGELEIADAAARTALASATAGRDDEAVAEAWVRYLWHVGEVQGRIGDGLAWEPMARAAIARLRRPDQARALLDNQVAMLRWRDGRHDQALGHARTALTTLEGIDAGDGWQYAATLITLGNVLSARGDKDAALATYRRAAALLERVHGAGHPSLGNVVNNIGAIYFDRSQHDLALRHYQDALAIYRAGQGDGTPDVADAMLNIATVHAVQGHFDRAVALYRQALAIQERAKGPDAPDVAQILYNQSLSLLEQGHLDEARAAVERALRIWTGALAADHPFLAYGLETLGTVAARQGHSADALEHYRRALDIAERRLGADHSQVATVLTSRGVLETRLGQRTAAKATLQRALAVADRVLTADDPERIALLVALARVEPPAGALQRLERAVALAASPAARPGRAAEARLALAQALWPAPAARERARGLARQARTTWAGLGEAGAAGVRSADDWLRGR